MASSSMPLLGDTPDLYKKLSDGTQRIAVNVLNPRLNKFGGRSCCMASYVLSFVFGILFTLMFYQRVYAVAFTDALVPPEQAESIGFVDTSSTFFKYLKFMGLEESDDGLCETNTTASSVLQELLRLAKEHEIPPEGLSESNTVEDSLAPNIKMDMTMDFTDRYSSIFAPLMQGKKHAKIIEKMCSVHSLSDIHLHNKHLATQMGLHFLNGIDSIDTCWALAADDDVYFEYEKNFKWCSFLKTTSLCDFDQFSPENMKCANLRDLPTLIKAPSNVNRYIEFFGPMMKYGKFLGEESPSPDDIIKLRPIQERSDRQVVLFTAAFVNYTEHVYKKLYASTQAFIFPCEMRDCSEYTCFTGRKTVCAPSIKCSVTEGIVSTTKAHRHSIFETLIQAVALSHNLEILGSLIVVIFVLFCVMTKDERDDLHLSGSQMSAIIFKKQKRKESVDDDSMDIHDTLEGQNVQMKLQELRTEMDEVKVLLRAR